VAEQVSSETQHANLSFGIMVLEVWRTKSYSFIAKLVKISPLTLQFFLYYAKCATHLFYKPDTWLCVSSRIGKAKSVVA
jgi:hypothetical protein